MNVSRFKKPNSWMLHVFVLDAITALTMAISSGIITINKKIRIQTNFNWDWELFQEDLDLLDVPTYA